MSDYQPTICVITPTISRDSLKATLESATLSPRDDWVVIGDGPQPKARAIVESLGKNRTYLRYMETEVQRGNWGNIPRDVAMKESPKDYFIFLDDDDVFAPNAMPVLKAELAKAFPCPVMFRLITADGRTIWKDHRFGVGNIAGSMFACRNVPGRIGRWDNDGGYQSDFHFIEQTLNYYPNWRTSLVWSGEVIILCQPNGGTYTHG